MTGFVLGDQAARDAIDGVLDATLFVEAGAGSGKTRHLVSRVVALVTAGTPLSALAAITFTEAAAAELRQRIRHELEAVAADPAAEAIARQRAAEALAEVDHAAICTLHAFAQRILAEFPVEVGLPPHLEVLDEIRSELAFEARWSRQLDELFDEPDAEELLLRSLALGVQVRHLRQLARVLDDNHDRLDRWPDVAPGPVRVDDLVRRLDEVLLQREHCLDASDELDGHLRDVVGPFADGLRRAADDHARLEALQPGTKLSCARGRQPNWADGVCAAVKEELKAIQADRDALVAEHAHACLSALARRVAAFTLDAAEARRREGTLEFHDLLVLARQLLRSHPEARRVLHDRYRCLLLDEFQDTDPLQIELAVLIATHADDREVGTRGWQELPVEPGRLFFVGDPKQSIYRFRRADIELFMAARTTFTTEPTVLSHNFRSVPGVLEFVNGLFAELFGGGVEGRQPAYAPLEPVRGPGDRPAVWLCGGPVEEGARDPAADGDPDAELDVSADGLRAIEARAVAAMVRRVLDEGWSVGEGEERRPVRPDDIAILLPTRLSLRHLERALEDQRLPFRAETGSLVWDSDEVRDLLTVLRAIDDTSDEAALVAALRSPAFGCGDDDLLAYRQAGGRWSLLATPPDEVDERAARVVAALAELRGLHGHRWWTGVAGMVDLVVRTRRLFEVALDDTRPRDAWRRLRFVVDQARAFDESVGGTLREFLEWAEGQRSDTVAVATRMLPEPDDRAVRILTIHGSKGLEFPVTVVSGLTTRPPTGRRGVAVHFADDGSPPHVRLASHLETVDFDQAQTVEEQLDDHERLRLLYVALTRARDHLVVATTHKPAKRPSYAQQIWSWAAEHPDAWVAGPDGLTVLPPPAELQPWETAGRGVPWSPPAPGWEESWTAAVRAAAAPPAIAATAVAAAAAGSDAHPAEAAGAAAVDEGPADPARPPWAKGRGGTAFGRAVHAVLQTISFDGGDDLAATARAQAAAEGIPDRAAEVEARARAALDAPVVQLARGHRHWRELYVGVPLGSVVVEGFVDLLVDTAEGLVVVDYKTDSVATPADVDAALARYRLQGATYALALHEHLGRPVVRCVFLFLTAGGPVEREVTDLAGAMAEVRELVSGGVAGR